MQIYQKDGLRVTLDGTWYEAQRDLGVFEYGNAKEDLTAKDIHAIIIANEIRIGGQPKC